MVRLLNPGEGDSHSSDACEASKTRTLARPKGAGLALAVVDILPAMNGRDSYGVAAGFAGISGFLPQPSAEDYEEALLSGYPPVGLLGAKNIYHAEKKGNRLSRPAYPASPA